MEKILKRAAQAARTADRRIAKRQEAVKKTQKYAIRLRQQGARKATTQLILDERKRRKEQWERGPLAPRYDVGPSATSYGTVPDNIINIPEVYKDLRPEWFHIKPGDRVVVLAGRSRGTITEVTEVDREKCVLSLSGINVDNELPSFMTEYLGGNSINARPMFIPFQNVKLVYPIPDAKSGVPKDTIIERMEPVGREWDRHKREWTEGQRLISGTDTVIPWPVEVEGEWDTYENDTTVDLIDAVTFSPTLLKAPMPLSVIDELRGKYSRFRTRYDWETKEKVTAKADKEEHRKELIKTMRTPLQQLAELRAQQKKAKERDLTTDQLARIGEIMAQSQSRGTTTTLRP